MPTTVETVTTNRQAFRYNPKKTQRKRVSHDFLKEYWLITLIVYIVRKQVILLPICVSNGTSRLSKISSNHNVIKLTD